MCRGRRPQEYNIERPNLLLMQGNLQVRADLHPIGGYRGQIGALTISHRIEGRFTEWSEDDIHNLAHLTNRILKIMEKALVTNVLIYGRQDGKSFTFHIVPYPKCNWYEKIKGAVDFVFGANKLKNSELREVERYYESRILDDFPFVPHASTSKEGDVFCREEAIRKQLVVELSLPSGRRYNILHDNRHKGVTKKDPHLLIVPKGKSGHVDGALVPEGQRFEMFTLAKKAMNAFAKRGSNFLYYVERNGAKLQGVHHKNAHAMGVYQLPKTFFQKCFLLMKLFFAPRLNDAELKVRISENAEIFKQL